MPKDNERSNKWSFRASLFTVIASIATITGIICNKEKAPNSINNIITVPETTPQDSLATLPVTKKKDNHYPTTANPGKREGEITVNYAGQIVDSSKGYPLRGLSIFCSSCVEKNIVTNASGVFELKKQFPEYESFQQTEISVSGNGKTVRVIIDMKEPSHEPIKF